jgi:uncharacterized membrane protein YbaN (DUF454 family)
MPMDKKTKENLTTEEQCLKPRPFWQRVIYPLVGMILIILGIILWIMPVVMGFPLIIIGVPLVCCFHPRLEQWVRRKMHTLHQAIKNKLKRN